MPAIATIGVYGFSGDAFLTALRDAGVAQVVDIRARRGVRGSEYAWANSKRLQAALAGAAIDYEHRSELAPTNELRRLQYAEDDRQGVGKRSRERLAPEYVTRYLAEILASVDLDAFAMDLSGAPGLSALFCVERDPEACHRSLVATRLRSEHGFAVRHLRPG